MIAIYTKYLGPTDTRGSRIKAYTLHEKPWTASIPYPHALSYQEAHFAAVKELVAKNKLDWNLKEMRFGDAPNGYVFCFADSIVGTP